MPSQQTFLSFLFFLFFFPPLFFGGRGGGVGAGVGVVGGGRGRGGGRHFRHVLFAFVSAWSDYLPWL